MLQPIQPFLSNNYIYRNYFRMNFEIDSLNENYFKIDKKNIYFIIPDDNTILFDINKLIEQEKKINIILTILNKSSKTSFIIYFQKLKFIKISNLIDFDYNDDYNDDDAKLKIKVEYKCKKQKIIKDEKHLKVYQRKEKLERLNEIN